MLESFTDNSRPSTNVSKNIPPFIPLPSKMPTNNSHTMAEMPVNVQRKDSAKRKMFEALKQEKCEATADNTHGNNADDFLDSDSDNMSFEGGSPRGARQSDDLGDKWKPASINLENIAAHIVQALNQSDAPRNTLGGLHVTNNVGSRDNLPIEVHTPNISPRRAEQVTTPPTQRAVVHTRPPPLPPKQSQQRMEIESMASSMTYDD
ncbi:hypothetical protein GGF43_004562 [Coemansia sp. RSA 2618]|nr:hypothetical protein GGF43_004562 [Coemansia sp. RSA 2618]